MPFTKWLSEHITLS